MKKTLLSLLLCLSLLLSVLPSHAAAAAATPRDALKAYAMSGSWDEEAGCYSRTKDLTEGGELNFGIFYLQHTGVLEARISSQNLTVGLRLAPETQPPYTAFIRVRAESAIEAAAAVPASYNGEALSALKSYSGPEEYREQVLEMFSKQLPWLLEYTRELLHGMGFKLGDLGLTGFTICHIHCYDGGRYTTKPTCVKAGVRTYTCVNCGAIRSEDVPPTYLHSWKLQSILTPDSDAGHGTAKFVCAVCQQTKTDRLCAGSVFTDMPKESNWAHAPIDWAYFSGITGGKTASSFAPKATCTRAEVVTFLWAAAGRPETDNKDCPFTDVKPSAYYYKPMLWALEKGFVGGKTRTRFAPKATCTRAEVMTFLWASRGKPEPGLESCPFTDVRPGKYYYRAVLWAVEHKITGGKSATIFAPKANCTRAQVVTFLYYAERLD